MARKVTYGEKAWAGLAAYVLVADCLAWHKDKDTMSVAFGAWLQTPHGKACCAAVWGLLTAHLWWSCPLPGQALLKRKVVSRRVCSNGTQLIN